MEIRFWNNVGRASAGYAHVAVVDAPLVSSCSERWCCCPADFIAIEACYVAVNENVSIVYGTGGGESTLCGKGSYSNLNLFPNSNNTCFAHISGTYNWSCLYWAWHISCDISMVVWQKKKRADWLQHISHQDRTALASAFAGVIIPTSQSGLAQVLLCHALRTSWTSRNWLEPVAIDLDRNLCLPCSALSGRFGCKLGYNQWEPLFGDPV